MTGGLSLLRREDEVKFSKPAFRAATLAVMAAAVKTWGAFLLREH
jgi:hypothetical protein